MNEKIKREIENTISGKDIYISFETKEYLDELYPLFSRILNLILSKPGHLGHFIWTDSFLGWYFESQIKERKEKIMEDAKNLQCPKIVKDVLNAFLNQTKSRKKKAGMVIACADNILRNI